MGRYFGHRPSFARPKPSGVRPKPPDTRYPDRHPTMAPDPRGWNYKPPATRPKVQYMAPGDYIGPVVEHIARNTGMSGSMAEAMLARGLKMLEKGLPVAKPVMAALRFFGLLGALLSVAGMLKSMLASLTGANLTNAQLKVGAGWAVCHTCPPLNLTVEDPSRGVCASAATWASLYACATTPPAGAWYPIGTSPTTYYDKKLLLGEMETHPLTGAPIVRIHAQIRATGGIGTTPGPHNARAQTRRIGLSVPMPALASEVTVGERRRPQRRNRWRNSVVPALNIQMPPPGGGKAPVKPGWHHQAPPPRGFRERKGRAIPRVAEKVISAITEGMDWVSCLHKGLPKADRTPGARPHVKIQDIVRNIHKIDPVAALTACAENHFEDKLYGKLGQARGATGRGLSPSQIRDLAQPDLPNIGGWADALGLTKSGF